MVIPFDETTIFTFRTLPARATDSPPNGCKKLSLICPLSGSCHSVHRCLGFPSPAIATEYGIAQRFVQSLNGPSRNLRPFPTVSEPGLPFRAAVPPPQYSNEAQAPTAAMAVT